MKGLRRILIVGLILGICIGSKEKKVYGNPKYKVNYQKNRLIIKAEEQAMSGNEDDFDFDVDFWSNMLYKNDSFVEAASPYAMVSIYDSDSEYSENQYQDQGTDGDEVNFDYSSPKKIVNASPEKDYGSFVEISSPFFEKIEENIKYDIDLTEFEKNVYYYDYGDEMEIQEVSFDDLEYRQDIEPENLQSVLSPSRNVHNAEFNEMFKEAKKKASEFLDMLKYYKRSHSNQLIRSEHYYVTYGEKTFKLILEDLKEINCLQGFVDDLKVTFYVGFYNDYVVSGKMTTIPAPTVYNYFLAILGAEPMEAMQSYMNEEKKYTLTLIDAFPINSKVETLIMESRPTSKRGLRYIHIIQDLKKFKNKLFEENYTDNMSILADFLAGSTDTVKHQTLNIMSLQLRNQEKTKKPRNDKTKLFLKLCKSNGIVINPQKHNIKKFNK